MRSLTVMPSTVWQGRLSFGMVTIPVRLYTAARRERTRFHQVFRVNDVPTEGRRDSIEPEEPISDQPDVLRFPASATRPAGPTDPELEPVMRVHNQPVSEDENAAIEKSRILKGYELEKGRYVVVSPAELAALRTRTSTELEITEFVRLSEIDPVYLDASYYVVPDTGGEKPYALLYTALKESRYVALGKLAMHGREHSTAIRPGNSGLILHTLFHASEVRSGDEYPTDPQLVSPKELELAKMLINAKAATFDPEKLKDTFDERLQALIHSRAASAVLVKSKQEQPKRASVVDIADALRQSLEAVRKPASREDRARGSKRKHRNTRRSG
ncbi:MAG TPA: Ku protein [Bryobacteraceae bacterium]|nr:Ku protein [Bryobacteraceae bacterium]